MIDHNASECIILIEDQKNLFILVRVKNRYVSGLCIRITLVLKVNGGPEEIFKITHSKANNYVESKLFIKSLLI